MLDKLTDLKKKTQYKANSSIYWVGTKPGLWYGIPKWIKLSTIFMVKPIPISVSNTNFYGQNWYFLCFDLTKISWSVSIPSR